MFQTSWEPLLQPLPVAQGLERSLLEQQSEGRLRQTVDDGMGDDDLQILFVVEAPRFQFYYRVTQLRQLVILILIMTFFYAGSLHESRDYLAHMSMNLSVYNNGCS